MDKIIKLSARGGGENYLQLLKPVKEGVESKTYLVKASEGIIPEYPSDENIPYLNIIDGPNIRVGDEIEGNKVRFIDFIAGFGCTITFE